jgi:hypothetical protein
LEIVRAGKMGKDHISRFSCFFPGETRLRLNGSGELIFCSSGIFFHHHLRNWRDRRRNIPLSRFPRLPPFAEKHQHETNRRRDADDLEPRMPGGNVPAAEMWTCGIFGVDRE